MTKLGTYLVLGSLGLSISACEPGSIGSAAGGAGGAGSTTSANASSQKASSAQTGATTSQSGQTSASATQAASTGSGTDPFEAARQACIAKINALRATKSLTPYNRWMSAESCVDQQATSDETSGSPHGAWLSNTYPCNGSGQNECLGQGPGGIEGCLDQMWAEKDQPGCAGCDACADAYDPSCPNCDFYGMATGNVCGHYVNLSAKYHTEAACGFSSLGGWDAINFQ